MLLGGFLRPLLALFFSLETYLNHASVSFLPCRGSLAPNHISILLFLLGGFFKEVAQEVETF